MHSLRKNRYVDSQMYTVSMNNHPSVEKKHSHVVFSVSLAMGTSYSLEVPVDIFTAGTSQGRQHRQLKTAKVL